jgi:hypothetical protein
MMRRREFITLLGGAVATWPIACGAQPKRMRRIGSYRDQAQKPVGVVDLSRTDERVFAIRFASRRGMMAPPSSGR